MFLQAVCKQSKYFFLLRYPTITILAYTLVLYEFLIFIFMLFLRGFLDLPFSLCFTYQGQAACRDILDLLNKNYMASSTIKHEFLHVVKVSNLLFK